MPLLPTELQSMITPCNMHPQNSNKCIIKKKKNDKLQIRVFKKQNNAVKRCISECKPHPTQKDFEKRKWLRINMFVLMLK